MPNERTQSHTSPLGDARYLARNQPRALELMEGSSAQRSSLRKEALQRPTSRHRSFLERTASRHSWRNSLRYLDIPGLDGFNVALDIPGINVSEYPSDISVIEDGVDRPSAQDFGAQERSLDGDTSFGGDNSSVVKLYEKPKSAGDGPQLPTGFTLALVISCTCVAVFLQALVCPYPNHDQYIQWAAS